MVNNDDCGNIVFDDYSDDCIAKVTKFFEIRFPDKDIEFEKECGYFWEWCGRLKIRSHRRYADEESMIAWNKVFEYDWGCGVENE